MPYRDATDRPALDEALALRARDERRRETARRMLVAVVVLLPPGVLVLAACSGRVTGDDPAGPGVASVDASLDHSAHDSGRTASDAGADAENAMLVVPDGHPPPNAYGRYGGIYADCRRWMGAAFGDDPSGDCEFYGSCSLPCAVPADCPYAGSGDAGLVCDDRFNRCDLDCSDGQTCPEGMECLTVDSPTFGSSTTCMWPWNLTDRCCSQEEFRCEEQAHCCEGLTCRDGYCR